ncbi:MAG: glycosyltransferase, partial [Armatimonadetes bacterium]|nr:glycosyltransferase [Armatimonadota bacterium]
MRVGLPAWRLLAPRGGVGNTLWHLLQQYRELAPGDEFVVYHEAEAALPAGPNIVPRRLNVRPFENNLTWNDLALPRAVRRDRIDLLHNLSYTLPARLTVPAVVTVHDVSYLRHPEWFSPRAARWLRRGTLRAARQARVVTDSHFSAAEIAELCGLPRSQIAVVPLAAEERYQPTDPAELRARLGLPQRFVLYLGGLLERRRLDL